MTEKVFNVLFLCTGNSARSIMAESILNSEANGRFRAWSAGSHPKGEVHPLALKTLKELGYRSEGFRSKSWDEFSTSGALHFDFIITLCDSAAGEACPIARGTAKRAHWGIEDPAAFEGTQAQKELAFHQAAQFLKSRILAFTNLPLETIEAMALESKLKQIGGMDGATELAGKGA
ncbi:arsenate reductase ArsC [Martelella alba]|uniref:Arsenate reductase ArsC n=1 Tax=Martelella alba TaxID=2590451 RepID=A0A506UIW6_9HYPH|nr:arsenate reductase ArsC [Martelella alba]TPW33257.1 arsenate reductase ArsC [Martelella alba]